MKYIVDTNVVIDYLRDYQPTIDFLRTFTNDQKINIYLSSITNLELHLGQSIKDKVVKRKIDNFVKKFHIIDVNFITAGRAGDLKRDLKMSFVDAILAATAILQNLILVTKNRKHFQEIKGLKIISP